MAGREPTGNVFVRFERKEANRRSVWQNSAADLYPTPQSRFIIIWQDDNFAAAEVLVELVAPAIRSARVRCRAKAVIAKRLGVTLAFGHENYRRLQYFRQAKKNTTNIAEAPNPAAAAIRSPLPE